MFGTPYGPTTRWFRTANDVDVVTSQRFKSGRLESIDDVVEALAHVHNRGAAHPNALGFAAIADSILAAVSAVVRESPDRRPPGTQ
jgi:hypothetical protein